jgi:hypothetical protein
MLVLAVGSTLCGCGASTVTKQLAPRAPGREGAALPVRTISARLVHAGAGGGLQWGTKVGPGFPGDRVFGNRSVGFALTQIPPAVGATYPVATTNGGGTWRTAGPPLYRVGAPAAADVNDVGIVGSALYVAWCGACSSTIDVTSDAGKKWWRAHMPGNVLAVLDRPAGREKLLAIVVGHSGTAGGTRGVALWTYQSVDGRRWTYSHNGQPTR